MGAERTNPDQIPTEPKRDDGQYGDERRMQEKSDADASQKLGEEGPPSKSESPPRSEGQ